MIILAETGKKYDDAMNKAREYLEHFPDHAGLWETLGYIYGRKEMHKEGIDAYKKAIQSQPDNPLHWDNLSYLYHALGMEKERDEAYRKVSETDPDYSIRHTLDQAEFRHHIGRQKTALRYVQTVLKKKPGQKEAMRLKAQILIALGQPGRALRILQRMKKKTTDLILSYDIARALYGTRKFGTAAGLLKKITAKEPLFQQAWQLYGECLKETGPAGKALSAFEKAYQLDQEEELRGVCRNKYDIRLAQAKICALTGDAKNAMKYLDDIEKYNPGFMRRIRRMKEFKNLKGFKELIDYRDKMRR